VALKRIEIKKKTWLFILAVLLFSLDLSAGEIENNIPSSAMAIFNKAKSLADKNNIPRAIEELERFKKEQAAKKEQVPPVLLFTLGNYHMEAGKKAQAAINYEKVLEQADDFAPAWINLAQAYYDLQNFKRAGNCFIKGYDKSEKKRADILYYAANSFFSANDFPKAMEIFNRVMKNHSNEVQPIWHELMVNILLSLQKPEKAISHMEILAEKLDGKPKIQWQETLLYHYINLKMTKKALELLLFLTNHYPLEPRWWKGLAQLNLDSDQFENALVSITIYSYLTPLTTSEKKLMADLNLQVGIPVKAADLYGEIIKKESRPELVKKTVAAFQQMHLYEKALETLDQGIKNYGTSVELKMIKGNLLFSMEHYKEAAEEFKSLVDKDKSGQAWLMLGYSLVNLEDFEPARRAMEKAAFFKNQKQAAERAIKNIPSP